VTTYRFIHVEEANHAVRLLCRVLEVSRSAYYAWRAGETHTQKRSDRQLLVHIRAIHRRHKGRYGAPRITAELREQGFMVNRKRVARIMRDHDIQGRVKRRFCPTTTDSKHRMPVAPNLLKRDFSTNAPNQAFVGDITYLRTSRGWVYLAVLIDLFSRKVVGWAMDDTMETSLCLRALDRALATRGDVRGAIHHTDRGSQYASRAYRERIAKAGMVASMSRKGDCWDNAVAESFFGTLEQELVPEAPWPGLPAARRAVSTYIHRYYNTQRRHSTLGQVAPTVYEARHHAAVMAAA
jgi:putative transposase